MNIDVPIIARLLLKIPIIDPRFQKSIIETKSCTQCEMLRTECTPFELAIIYNMAAPNVIDLNNNPFNKDTVAVSQERVIYPTSL